MLDPYPLVIAWIQHDPALMERCKDIVKSNYSRHSGIIDAAHAIRESLRCDIPYDDTLYSRLLDACLDDIDFTPFVRDIWYSEKYYEISVENPRLRYLD